MAICLLKMFPFSKDIISVEANVAAAFNLRTYETMIMNIVDPASVSLDSVEITFKDQYMGRSEMWRLKSFLVRVNLFAHLTIFNIGYSSDKYLCLHEQEN